MKTPMTTAQAIERFGDNRYTLDDNKYTLESSTCSMLCKKCGERIWFQGSWTDASTPKTFDCPYCKTEQVGPDRPRLDKGDLSVLITICEKELGFSTLSKRLVQPTLDKLNEMLKELR